MLFSSSNRWHTVSGEPWISPWSTESLAVPVTEAAWAANSSEVFIRARLSAR